MLKKTGTHPKIGQTVLWGGLFLFTVLLQILSRNADGFAEWYACSVYPLLMRVIGGVSNLFPFAVDELIAYAAAVFVLSFLARGIRWVRRKEMPLRDWLRRLAV